MCGSGQRNVNKPFRRPRNPILVAKYNIFVVIDLVMMILHTDLKFLSKDDSLLLYKTKKVKGIF